MSFSLINRRRLVILLSLALSVLLLVPVAEAGNKKKKKKKQAAAETTTEESSQAEESGRAEAPAEVKLAIAHLEAYKTQAAREALQPLAGSNDPVVLTARGRIDAQAKDYDKATATLRQAADLDTANPAPTLYLGDAFAYAKKSDLATDAWKQAETRAKATLAANPESLEGLYFLGSAQRRQRKFAEAAATLQTARSLAPKDPQIAFEAGCTDYFLANWQSAFDGLSLAIEQNPDWAYAYYFRGMAAGKLDRKDLLFNDLNRFVKMAPEAPEAANAKQILAAFK